MKGKNSPEEMPLLTALAYSIRAREESYDAETKTYDHSIKTAVMQHTPPEIQHQVEWLLTDDFEQSKRIVAAYWEPIMV